MRSAVGSDEQTHLTDFVVEGLKGRDHELELRGPLAGEAMLWPEAAERVAEGGCPGGVLFCWRRGLTSLSQGVE